MAIDPSIFKSYDIRAIYPTQLNEKNIIDVGKAMYKFFSDKVGKPDVTIGVSRDIRISSPALFNSLTKTLLECGANVIDLGTLATTTFYFSIFYYKYDAGIQITASHNPKEWNGMKFVLRTPNGLLKIGKPTGMEQIKEMSLNGVVIKKNPKGKITKNEKAMRDEVENSLNIVEHPNLKKFKIVTDPANAMGITYLTALEKKISMELIKMNFELDGNFPAHQPDPIQPENLVDLQKRVIEEKADFGLAPDGDGDRLFIIDENGDVVPASIITAIIAEQILKRKPGGKVVVDQKYILTTKKIVEENGGELLLSRTGHAYITELMTKSGAVFAGEASAHYYYEETGNAESQTTTILFILKILTETGKTLSQLSKDYRRSFESGEINFEVSNAQETLEKLKTEYSDGELSEMDGVTITYPDWRVSLRTSNTEPLLRFNLEGYDKDIVDAKTKEVLYLIKGTMKHD